MITSSRSYGALSRHQSLELTLLTSHLLFHIPQTLCPKFFKAPPFDEQVVATSNPRGSVPASTVVDHRKVVEALYEVFMGTFRTNWHTSLLVCYFFNSVQDSFARGTALFLYQALVEERKVCLAGASSSLGLIRRQEMSTLGNWTPLRFHLEAIPFQGGLLFDGEILQQADCLDNEAEQLKKARGFGLKRGSIHNIFRNRSRGGSISQSSAPTGAPTTQTQSSSRGGH